MKKRLESEFDYIKIVKVLLIIIMVFSFYNGAGLGVAHPQQFDVFSDEAVISDIIHDSTQENRLMLQWPDNETLGDGNIKNALIEENTDYLNFYDYLSNMGFQSQIFRVIYELLPFSNDINLQILYLFNATIMTISTLLFLHCIKDFIGQKACDALFLILLFVSPTFMNYGRNLYWLGYMIFLPFLSSMLLCKYKYGDKKFYIYSFGTAFVACALKLLCSYEFVSGVMISCIIPYVLYNLKNRVNIKGFFKNVIFPSLGCLLGFVAALGIHSFIIQMTIGNTNLVEVMSTIFAARIYGDANAEIPLVAEAANAATADVVSSYFKMVCFSIFGLEIRYVDIVFVFLLSYVAVKQFGTIEVRERIEPLFLAALLSITAPVSWFVLAKPHAYIHTTQCALLWYLPFMLLVLAYFCGLFFMEREKK